MFFVLFFVDRSVYASVDADVVLLSAAGSW